MAFWSASSLVLSGHGLDVWDPIAYTNAQSALFPHTSSSYLWFYPPTFLLVVTPLALAPYPVAWCRLP